MSYTIVPTVITGDFWTASDQNTFLGDNFRAGVPHIFTAKGQLAIGASADNAVVYSKSSTDWISPVVDTTQTYNLVNAYARIPIGGIVIWSGSTGSIPSNFQICDGTGGTIDLRNRMVVGAGSTYAAGNTGGQTTINLAHTHTQGSTGSSGWAHTHTMANTNSESTHQHYTTPGQLSGWDNINVSSYDDNDRIGESPHRHDFWADWSINNTGHSHAITTMGSGGSSHTHTNPTTASAGSATQSNLPPYYALAFIQRTT